MARQDSRRAAGRTAASFPSGEGIEDQLRSARPVILAALRSNGSPAVVAAAEDIAQEALIRLARILSRRSETAGPLPSSYLWKAVHSATVDAIRKHRRGAAHEEAMPPEESPSRADGRSALEAGYAVRAALRACLGQLAAARRHAVLLYLQGHGIPEIARYMSWTRARARNLAYRGLANLRACLSGRGVFP